MDFFGIHTNQLQIKCELKWKPLTSDVNTLIIMFPQCYVVATVAVASQSRIISSKTYQQQLRGLAYPSGHSVYNKPNQWRSHNMTHRIQMCQTPSDVVDVGHPERSYIHPLKALCHSVSTRGTSKHHTGVCNIFVDLYRHYKLLQKMLPQL